MTKHVTAERAGTCAALFAETPDAVRERIEFSTEVEELALEYVARGAVSEAHIDGCRYVAAATIGRADAIVSWSLRHIVKLDKIKGPQSGEPVERLVLHRRRFRNRVFPRK